jgi:diguanylate cyclase (GGDEF)-like protein
MLLLVQVAHTHTMLASAILILSFAALCIRVLVIQHRLAQAQEALQHEAAHDALTGLPNRGAIFDILEKEAQRFKRGGHPFGLIIADIDFFKRINDNYGHPTGDLVLQQVADKLKDTLRSYDSVGRYGGEEFLIITPNCDRGATLASAERLRRSIAELEIPTAFGAIPVRLSLGAVSASNGEDCGCSALLRRADDALYRAKAHGRNRVEQASENPLCADIFVSPPDETLASPS